MISLLLASLLLPLEGERADSPAALLEVVREVSSLCEAEEFEAARARLDAHEEALASLEPMSWLERLQGGEVTSFEDRALQMHARAVMEMQAGELEDAVEAFEVVRAQAGPGKLRQDATYDLGVLFLGEGERFRALIPEVSGTQAGPSPAPADAEEAPDPLEEARKRYLKAREWFAERLMLDWRDADTRANAELVQRRLRELDEIERQREEEEQQEQEEQREGEDPQESDEEGDESSEDDQQEGEETPEDAEGEREPQEPEGEEQDPEEQQPEEEEPEVEPEEVHLTQEEMQRLLEALREIEEEGEKVQEALQRIGRQNVDRDW